MKKLSILFILLGICLCVHSQEKYRPFSSSPLGSSKDFTPPSPNAASLGIYGQIPVGNFTGIPEINIPLYELRYKDLSIPISISYHASGNKPDLVPGPVGMGWSLVAGGCITRVIQGNKDFQPYMLETLKPAEFTPDLRTMNDWCSMDVLKKHLYSPFATKNNTMEPDIFYFNFNGYSGKFYVDETDTFRIQSSQGQSFKVAISSWGSIFESDFDIASFTMVDSKGIIYKFKQYEITQHYEIDGKTIRNENGDIVFMPTAWYLTSIQSPNGYEITFKYKKHSLYTRTRFADIVLRQYSNGSMERLPGYMYMDSEKTIVVQNSLVEEIKTPNGTVEFDISLADKQLKYPEGRNYRPFSPHKIDYMRVYNNHKDKLKEIRFIYTNDTTTRLKLVTLSTSDGQARAFDYHFGYNRVELPPYLSWSTDMYGFYNGTILFEGVDPESYVDRIMKYPQYFYNMKTPDLTSTLAEMLTKITYPTGGYTDFEYESHSYSSIYNIAGTNTTDDKKNNISAGIRIKQITDYDSPGKIIDKKIYHYEKDYINGGKLSSGVLVYTPEFIESYNSCKVWGNESQSYNLSYFLHFSTNPIFPLMDTRGSHVTYSEVTVEKPSGYFNYRYKNFDNGYPDQPFLNAVASKFQSNGQDVDLMTNDERTSMDLERGQLTSERIYNKNKNIKKEISYSYNDDPNRFNHHVKFIRYAPTIMQQSMGYNHYKLEAGYIYTYFPYLKIKEEREYLDKIFSRKTSYVYDEQYNLLKEERTENVDNQSLVTTYTYPHEESSGSIRDSMLQRRMLAYPVKEERKYKSGTYSLTNKYDIGLSDQNPRLIALKEVSLKINGKGTYPEVIYSKYDSIGNPLQLESLSEGNICYIWSYNKEYPVAKIEGATFWEVKNVLTEEYLSALGAQSYPTDEDISELRSRLSPLNALVTTFTYSPMVGKTSETSPNGITTRYEYNSNGRLIRVKDHNGHTIKSQNYHFQNQY